MNVLITNKQEEMLSSLNMEVAKTLRGEYDVEELIGQFTNFYFMKMVLDVTAIKDYKNIVNYQKISIALPVDKIILLLPSDIDLEDPGFISKLISMGYYSFGKTFDEIAYLVEHPNSYKDVAHLHKLEPVGMQQVVINQAGPMQEPQVIIKEVYKEVPVPTQVYATEEIKPMPVIRILGIKNVTPGAGATTLTYLMKRELEKIHGVSALAVEVNKRDFAYFNDSSLVSVNRNELGTVLMNANNYRVVIIDLNDADSKVCDEVLYLVEPSILKLNKVLRLDNQIFNKLMGRKIVLNKTLVNGGNIDTFEYETGVKVFEVIKPLDDRSSKPMLEDILAKLGFIEKKENDVK